MIKILQESLSLKLHDKNTTRDDVINLDLLIESLRKGYKFEKDWLLETERDIEFELDKA